MTIGIGLHEGIPHQTYLDDPCERPSLSASMAGILLRDTPRHAWLAHPRLAAAARPPEGEEEDGEEDDRSGAKGRGTLIHALVLGGGAEFVTVLKTDAKTGVVEEAADLRTKSAQEHKVAILAGGQIPVIGSKLKAAKALAERIRGLVHLPGACELTAVWESDGVLCRGRMDHIVLDTCQIDDLKTCPKISRAATGNHVLDFGLHLQEASYRDALETLRPEMAGRVPPMRFVFVEVESGEVAYRTLDAELREFGDRQWRRAKTLWKHCLDSGQWPGYSREVAQIAAPPKLAFLEEEQMMKAMPAGGSEGLEF